MKVGRKTVNRQPNKDLIQQSTSSSTSTGFCVQTSSDNPNYTESTSERRVNSPIIITTTSTTLPNTESQTKMTFGGADRSNLSLPTRPRNSTLENSNLSAMASNILDRDARGSDNLMKILMGMMPSDTQRGLNDTSPGFQFQSPLAPPSQTIGNNNSQPNNEILETPTPTKIIYPNPKSVTSAQKDFAEGFNQALRQVQIQHQYLNNQTPVLQSPSFANLIINLLTPLGQTSTFPLGSTSNLNSPVDATKATLTRPEGESLTQLSPTAPNSSSTATTLSPLSDNSLVGQLSKTTSSTVTDALSELAKKNLDSNSCYMDIFHPHRVGDLSALSRLNQQSSNSSNSMLQPHLAHSSSGSISSRSQYNQPSIAVKSEPMHSTSSPPLSVAASTLAAIHNGYGPGSQLIHSQPMPQNPVSGACIPQMTQATSSRNYMGHPGMDMDDQEKKKLERKRARNRAAASKCRQRKLERIQELELQVQQERQRTADLKSAYDRAQLELQQLQTAMEEHRRSGCSFPKQF